MWPFVWFPIWFQVFSIKWRSPLSDRFVKAFSRSGPTQTVAINISTGLQCFGIPVFFTNLSLRKFLVRYLTLFYLFLIIDGFKCLDRNSLEEYPVNAGVSRKVSFLVLHFSYYIWMTLMMLSVILLSIIILLSTRSVIRDLIYGNSRVAFWTWIRYGKTVD